MDGTQTLNYSAAEMASCFFLSFLLPVKSRDKQIRKSKVRFTCYEHFNSALPFPLWRCVNNSRPICCLDARKPRSSRIDLMWEMLWRYWTGGRLCFLQIGAFEGQMMELLHHCSPAASSYETGEPGMSLTSSSYGNILSACSSYLSDFIIVLCHLCSPLPQVVHVCEQFNHTDVS